MKKIKSFLQIETMIAGSKKTHFGIYEEITALRPLIKPTALAVAYGLHLRAATAAVVNVIVIVAVLLQ